MIYRTNFKLAAPVTDMNKANNYLHEEDMTQFIDSDLEDCVMHIEWNLIDNEQGYIEVRTNDVLSIDDSKKISEWICGQCSDGLGEGFEQQDFAFYMDDELDDYVCASFDWQTNDYELFLVE